MNPVIVEHPLAGDLLAQLRHFETPPERYRILASHLTTMLVLEATRGLRVRSEAVQTPLERVECPVVDQGLGAVPILRAGLGMLQPVLDLYEDVKVGYIGLERDHDTAVARLYYNKLPDFSGRFVLCLDPMLATGGSASDALTVIKRSNPERLVMVSILATPAGLARLQEAHSDVLVVTAAVDRELNSQKYILPGLGDFGDRLYGTF